MDKTIPSSFLVPFLSKYNFSESSRWGNTKAIFLHSPSFLFECGFEISKGLTFRDVGFEFASLNVNGP